MANRWRLIVCGLGLLMAGMAPRAPFQVAEGVASFYADSFHGLPTASAETYDKRSRTAAHPTLPFGTRVRVINLENGRSVWVRINDRGPAVEGRIIDLSKAAARKLRMTEGGTVRVRLEIYAKEES